MWDTIIAWLTVFLMIYGAISLLSGITLFAVIFTGEWTKERRRRNAHFTEEIPDFFEPTLSSLYGDQGDTGTEIGEKVV